MHEETQHSGNLKLIVFFDPEDQTLATWDHNLTSEKKHRGNWTGFGAKAFPHSR